MLCCLSANKRRGYKWVFGRKECYVAFQPIREEDISESLGKRMLCFLSANKRIGYQWVSGRTECYVSFQPIREEDISESLGEQNVMFPFSQ